MMTNPIIHALVFIAAVVIPGGLLVYFAWRACSKRIKANIEPPMPTPESARKAFLSMYPKESRIDREGWQQIDIMRIAKTRPRNNSQ